MRILLLVGLSGCSLFQAPVSQEMVNEFAPNLSTVGHPFASFQTAEVVDWQSGLFGDEPFVDVAITYQRPKIDDANTMNVRLVVHSTSPCQVSLSVLSDDGPDPILLDNALAKNAFAKEICSRW